jgi:hypothetical protein
MEAAQKGINNLKMGHVSQYFSESGESIRRIFTFDYNY